MSAAPGRWILSHQDTAQQRKKQPNSCNTKDEPGKNQMLSEKKTNLKVYTVLHLCEILEKAKVVH